MNIARYSQLSAVLLPLALLTCLGLFQFGVLNDRGLVAFALVLFILLTLSYVRSSWARLLSLKPAEDGGQLLLFFGLLLWVVIQACNPSYAVSEYGGLAELEHLSWLPSTVSASLSWASLSWLVLCMMVYLFGRGLAFKRSSQNIILYGLIALALVQAGMAITQRLTPVPFDLYPTTGTFGYENHFAAYINLFVPITLLAGLRAQREAHMNGSLSHPGYLFYFAGIMLLLSVVFSESRAGIAVGLLLLVAVISMVILPRLQEHLSLRSRVVLLGVFAMAIMGVLTLGYETLRAEWSTAEHIPDELIFRGEMIQGGINIFRDRWFGGSGLGTFALVFPFFKPETFEGLAQHAHCDAVELFAELGFFGGLLATVIFIGIFLKLGVQNLFTKRGNNLMGLGATFSFVGVVLHSMVDFSFHSGPLVLSLALLLGVCSKPRSLTQGVRVRH